MTNKERFEAIWNSRGCLCPSHRVWWTKGGGYRIHGFSFKRGRLVPLKGLSRKKGYTWLCRNYGLYSRTRWMNTPEI